MEDCPQPVNLAQERAKRVRPRPVSVDEAIARDTGLLARELDRLSARVTNIERVLAEALPMLARAIAALEKKNPGSGPGMVS